MSKKAGQRKKRRKAHKPPLCPSCHAPADASPPSLLAALAGLLNTAERAGVKVRVRHGALFAHQGVILPPAKKRPWEARAFGVLPQSLAEDEAGDEMDA